MKVLVFSIYDQAVEAYTPPMFFQTKGAAMRSFADAVNKEGSEFNRHAGDYTLFHIGYFDEGSGELSPQVPVDALANALQLLERLSDVDIVGGQSASA